MNTRRSVSVSCYGARISVDILMQGSFRSVLNVPWEQNGFRIGDSLKVKIIRQSPETLTMCGSWKRDLSTP